MFAAGLVYPRLIHSMVHNRQAWKALSLDLMCEFGALNFLIAWPMTSFAKAIGMCLVLVAEAVSVEINTTKSGISAIGKSLISIRSRWSDSKCTQCGFSCLNFSL